MGCVVEEAWAQGGEVETDFPGLSAPGDRELQVRAGLGQ